jgi:hypothetical protein
MIALWIIEGLTSLVWVTAQLLPLLSDKINARKVRLLEAKNKIQK